MSLYQGPMVDPILGEFFLRQCLRAGDRLAFVVHLDRFRPALGQAAGAAGDALAGDEPGCATRSFEFLRFFHKLSFQIFQML
jgi:hypothetical protein